MIKINGKSRIVGQIGNKQEKITYALEKGPDSVSMIATRTICGCGTVIDMGTLGTSNIESLANLIEFYPQEFEDIMFLSLMKGNLKEVIKKYKDKEEDVSDTLLFQRALARRRRELGN